MLELEEVKRRLADRVIVRGVDRLPRGHIRIETGLLYPDGSSVDVFLVNNAPLLADEPTAPVRLSDLGQTTAWLLDLQVRPWQSKKRQAFVEDVLRLHGVQQDGAELFVDVPRDQDLTVGILKLGQACIRVADLMFTRRASLQIPFTEDLEEVLVDAELRFEPNVEVPGRHGLVRLDYRVHGRERTSALLGLYAMNPQSAHNMANEVFRRWHDLDVPGRHEQNVTVYDDRQINVYRDEDLARLQELSVVVPFSDKESLIGMLEAA